MFRHIPVPRDTSVLRVPRDTSVLREIIIVCCESLGNCQTLSKDGPSQLVNNIIFRSFSLFFASDGPRFLPLFVPSRHAPTTCFVHFFSCLSIDSSLYHVIFSHVTVFSVFSGKSKDEVCDPQCEFCVIIF